MDMNGVGDTSSRHGPAGTGEHLLRIILEKSPLGIAILCGMELRFQWVNETYAANLGVAPEDVTGRTLLDLIPAARESGAVDRMRTALTTGQPSRVRAALYPIGDRQTWWNVDNVPLGPYQGCENALLILAHDVTDQVLARKQVEFEHARLQAVLNSLPVAVWITDATGRIVQKNTRADQIWAGDAPMSESVEAYGVYESWRHDTGEPLLLEERPLYRALAGERVLGVELDIRRFDGSSGAILASAAPILDPDGRVAGAVGVSLDITEIEQAKRALRASEARLRVALENTLIAIFTTDRELRYNWVQDKLFGRPAEELIGRRADQVLRPQDAAELMAEQRAALKNGKGVHREISVWVDGELKTYNLTLEPVRDELGEIAGLTGAMMDVTRNRRLEAEYYHHRAKVEMQRRLVQRLEEERTRIARDLHDGQLQNLIAASYNLAVASGTPDEGALREEVEEVRESLREQIVDLRQYLNELRPPTLAPFGLEKAIRSHAENFARRYPELTLQLDLEPDRQMLPEEGRMALFRIYQELLFNIRRHAGASEARVSLRVEPGEIVLEVSDNGVGFVPPEDWVDLAREGHLGLVGVRERAETVGGRVEVESGPEQGTRVRVVVPVEDEEAGD